MKEISAEPVTIDTVQQGVGDDYAVIIDRISQDVPFLSRLCEECSARGNSRDQQSFLGGVQMKNFLTMPWR